jgi:hypothetical protein
LHLNLMIEMFLQLALFDATGHQPDTGIHPEAWH